MRTNQKYATRFPHRAGIHLGAEAALLVVASILPLIGAARDAIRLTTCDSLDTAREWIEANVPAGSRIGAECFAPWVDRQKFSIQSFYNLNDQPPERHINEGYRYLVFSETVFRRFYKDPARLSDAIARYEAIFRACVETKVFTDGAMRCRFAVCRNRDSRCRALEGEKNPCC